MAPTKKKVSLKGLQNTHMPAGATLPKLTIKQIGRLTERDVIRRAAETHVQPFLVEVDTDNIGVYKVVHANTLHNTVTHTTTILFYTHPGNLPDDPKKLKELLKVPKGSELWNVPVWVTCNCEYFKFHCEVALHKFGVTDIIFSDGSYPDFTNPRMVPYGCKHIYALAPVAVSGQKIGKSLQPVKSVHPPAKGRLPRHLEEHLQRGNKAVPTAEEISEAAMYVRNFL